LRELSEVLTASQNEVQRGRETTALLTAQVESEREHVRRLEQTLHETSAQLAALQREQVDHQRLHDSLIERLAEHQRRFDALVHQLVERQRSQDAMAAELVATQKRAGDVSQQLVHSHADVLYLRQAYTQSQQRTAQAVQALAAMQAEYESISHSRSWRLTAPLRALFGVGRRLRGLLVSAPSGVARLPRRAAKRVLLSALAHLREHPERKARLGRVLRRSDKLNARLRRFAAANPAVSVRAPPPPRSVPPAAPEMPSPAVIQPVSDGSPAPHADLPDADLAGRVHEDLRQHMAAWPLGSRRNV
jgi:hypothetical protein